MSLDDATLKLEQLLLSILKRVEQESRVSDLPPEVPLHLSSLSFTYKGKIEIIGLLFLLKERFGEWSETFSEILESVKSSKTDSTTLPSSGEATESK